MVLLADVLAFSVTWTSIKSRMALWEEKKQHLAFDLLLLLRPS